MIFPYPTSIALLITPLSLGPSSQWDGTVLRYAGSIKDEWLASRPTAGTQYRESNNEHYTGCVSYDANFSWQPRLRPLLQATGVLPSDITKMRCGIQ